MPSEIEELQELLREFARERDWEQFHTPKNLAMALAAEAGELLEPFQWLTPEEAAAVMEGPRARDVEDELADVAIYLLRLADVLGLSIYESVYRKVARNRERFPAEAVYGRAGQAPGGKSANVGRQATTPNAQSHPREAPTAAHPGGSGTP